MQNYNTDYENSLELDKLVNIAIEKNDLNLWRYIMDNTDYIVSAHIISKAIASNNIEMVKYGFITFNPNNLYECSWRRVIENNNLEILEYMLSIVPHNIIKNHMNIHIFTKVIETNNIMMLSMLHHYIEFDAMQLVFNLDQIQKIALYENLDSFINKLSLSIKKKIKDYYDVFILLQTRISRDVFTNIVIKFL